MYFFNKNQDSFNPYYFRSSGVSLLNGKPQKLSFCEGFTGEEKPVVMKSLLLILIGLLHLWGTIWLLKPREPITLAQPLMMEMTLVAAPGQQPTSAPPAPPKPVEPIQPKKKPVVKPFKKPVKKKKLSAKRQDKLPESITPTEEMLPAPSPIESFDDASETSRDAASTANTTKSASGTTGTAEPYSEASFNAYYGTNPKPKYPDVARSRGWQGKVLLRVSVSAEGLSESVTVHRSSGHEVLDDSAIAAVEKWQFIPAKRGNEKVSCSVIVPIIFTLNN
jgi:protein TonB